MPVVKDKSGNGNNAYVHGQPDYGTDDNGKETLVLDGKRDYLEIPDSGSYTPKDSMTGMVWANLPSAGTTKGVDADVADKVTEENLDSAVAFAKAFAARTGAVVAITGAIDIVADAHKAYCIRNGHPMMSSITGTGCQLSALPAAFVTATPAQPLEAAAAAVCAMGLAGEIAHSRLSPLDGNSTYRNYIIDAVYNMTPAQLEEGATYEVR